MHLSSCRDPLRAATTHAKIYEPTRIWRAVDAIECVGDGVALATYDAVGPDSDWRALLHAACHTDPSAPRAECPVCDGFVGLDTVAFERCRHFFHGRCVERCRHFFHGRWIGDAERRPQCPVCGEESPRVVSVVRLVVARTLERLLSTGHHDAGVFADLAFALVTVDVAHARAGFADVIVRDSRLLALARMLARGGWRTFLTFDCLAIAGDAAVVRRIERSLWSAWRQAVPRSPRIRALPPERGCSKVTSVATPAIASLESRDSFLDLCSALGVRGVGRYPDAQAYATILRLWHADHREDEKWSDLD